MQIDTDGEMPPETVRTLLWEHQGVEFTGDIPEYFIPPHPAPFAGELERQAREIYQHLGAAMHEELAEDRRFFLEHPSRNYRVRAAFPAEEQLFREQVEVLQGPGTVPGGEMIVLIKQLAPGLRVREVMATVNGWKTISQDVFAILDEEHNRYMWRMVTGEFPDGDLHNK